MLCASIACCVASIACSVASLVTLRLSLPPFCLRHAATDDAALLSEIDSTWAARLEGPDPLLAGCQADEVRTAADAAALAMRRSQAVPAWSEAGAVPTACQVLLVWQPFTRVQLTACDCSLAVHTLRSHHCGEFERRCQAAVGCLCVLQVEQQLSGCLKKHLVMEHERR
jgi:hypothetical protein